MLSILVISHNQRDYLMRCFESIINQNLPFSYEIILSDDRSTDGTWDLIENYQIMYPDIVKGVKCNSDECNPRNNSERCGWNKLNAYKLSRGKYFVNLDADDYLVGTNLYMRQVERLEQHPECSMCMSRVWQINDGAEWKTGFTWPNKPMLVDGAVFDTKTFIIENLIGQNQTYMFRRNYDWNGDDFGKLFDDKFITFHHLLFGKCVFLDSYGYVWVQYRNSISHSISQHDNFVISGLFPLFRATMEPTFAPLFLKSGLSSIVHLLKYWKSANVPENKYIDYSRFDCFLVKYFVSSEKSWYWIPKIWWIRLVALFVNKYHTNHRIYYRYLYLILTNKSSYKKVPVDSWSFL